MRHLLSLQDLSRDDVTDLFQRARRFEAEQAPTVQGAAALFFPASSLRTRVTFERGAALMGLQPIVFPPETLDKSEDLNDVAAYLSSWVDLLVVRHADFRVLHRLASSNVIPVINAMTSINHPCEVLSDLYALSEFADPFEVRFLVVGPDGNIVRAWWEAAQAFGIDVVQSSPEGVRAPGTPWNGDLHDAVRHADVVITDARDEHEDEWLPYRITADLLDHGPVGIRFAPCPPFLSGRELSDDALEHPAFVGHGFKRHLLTVQQAIMSWALENAECRATRLG